MTQQIKDEITKIAKEFAEPFYETFGGINGTGWLIVDPLSGYLGSIGFENKLDQIPKNDKHPQIMVITFKDGSKLIPAGADLSPLFPDATNWQWI